MHENCIYCNNSPSHIFRWLWGRGTPPIPPPPEKPRAHPFCNHAALSLKNPRFFLVFSTAVGAVKEGPFAEQRVFNIERTAMYTSFFLCNQEIQIPSTTILVIAFHIHCLLAIKKPACLSIKADFTVMVEALCPNWKQKRKLGHIYVKRGTIWSKGSSTWSK